LHLSAVPAAILSNLLPFHFKNKKRLSKQGTPAGRSAMTRPGLRDLPRQNPCAQCGHPIAAPDWVEEQDDRIMYLWRCRACDYRFEAIAFFDHAHVQSRPLAA
jgi:hypothetical protein